MSFVAKARPSWFLAEIGRRCSLVVADGAAVGKLAGMVAVAGFVVEVVD